LLRLSSIQQRHLERRPDAHRAGARSHRCQGFQFRDTVPNRMTMGARKMIRRAAPILLAAGLICCGRTPHGAVARSERAGGEGHPASGTCRMPLDRNGDGRPDVTRTYHDQKIARIERDRNFDGKVDLVQVYSRGVLAREIHDDDFDGKPESIKTFRPDGTLAIIERDPQERGHVAVAEYFDHSGNLLRRETRGR
jgi:hypothetical protein